jgi:hypothetical protein
MSKAFMVSATSRAKRQVEDALRRAREVEEDLGSEERLRQGFCKACFYWPRLGGAAITSRPCMSCLEDQQYPSTDTHVLCASCAQEHGLCRHCGGDVEMRERRRNWPAKAKEID